MPFKNKPLQQIMIGGDNYGNIVQQITFSGLEVKNQLPRLLPPVEAYVGHQEDLQEIYAGLSKGKDIIILTGLGGIGKTEFSRYFGSIYFNGRAYYLNFKKSAADTFLDSDQIPLLNKISIFINRPDRHASFPEIMRQLCSILDKNDLLVIDNVTNLEGIDEIFRLPCHVLLTTRLLCDSVNLSTCLKYSLPLLTEPECVALFQNYYRRRTESDFAPEVANDIAKIVRLVNRHTLTLELLAKTCSKIPMDVKELTARLERYGFSLGGIDEKITKNNDITDRTFLEHMQKLFDITDILSIKGMRPLLGRLSVLKLDGLEVQYVCELLQLPNRNLLYELADYGWINIRQGQVFMHQVVSEIIKTQLHPGAKSLRALLKTLNSRLPSDAIVDDGPTPYVFQADILLRYLKDSHNTTICEICAKLGKIFYYRGKWQEAHYYLDRCIRNYTRRLFPNPLYLADLRSDMGRICKALGQYDTAMEHYNASLSIRTKYLPKDHPVFGELYSNMAAVYYQQANNYERAIELLKQAQAIQEKAFGADSHLTAETYNYLGLAYRAVDDYQTALYYFEEKALPIQRQYYGESSYVTAETTNNLAGVYRRLKNYTHALKLYQEALEMRKKFLDPKHPDLATSYNNIGLLYLDEGNWSLSLDYFARAVSIYEEALGKEHPYTSAVYLNMARTYMGKGEFSNAIHYGLLAKEIKEKKYPATNKSTLSTYELLAQAYEALGKYAEAREYRAKAGACLSFQL